MEARQHDRLWFKEKLQQSNVHTLRGFITAAKVALARNSRKDSCISALLDQVFPVAPRVCRTLGI